MTVLAGKRAAIVNWRDPGHSLAGGSERYAWECGQALLEAGAKVEFLTAREPESRAVEEIDGVMIRRRGSQFGFYPAVWGSLLWRWLARRQPFDIIIDAENGIPVFSPLVTSRTSVIVLVMHHVHQAQFRTYFPPLLAWLGGWLERRLMPRVYRDRPTIAVSESTRQEMVIQLGWRPAVRVIANGADHVEVVEFDDQSTDTSGRLVVLGRLATHKRIDLVIRAFRKLSHELPGLRLNIVGRGPMEPELRRLVNDLGLEETVTIHGYLSDADKEAVLRSSRLHLCASDAEGWGQVVIEAASHGIPTLARNVPGLRDSIRSGETGWLVDAPETAGEGVVDRLVVGMRDALLELEDRDRRAAIGTACRGWAEGFTWKRMHELLRAVVDEELIRRQGAR